MTVLTINPIDISNTTPTVPDVGHLTTNSIEGTGVFDSLMRVTKLHLQEEYNGGRITGKEYANVYLGALSSVMEQAVNFLLNQQQTDKLNAEIGLIRQKTVTELAQTDNTLPLGLGFNGDGLVEGLVANQITLTASQIAKSERDIDLVGQQIVTELANTDNEIPAGLGFNNSAFMEGMVEAQKDKLAAESLLVTQKLVTELAQTGDELPIGLGSNLYTTIDGIIKGQKALTDAQTAKTLADKLKADADVTKVGSEVILLDQKAVTELAQTAEYIPAGSGLNTTTAVNGMIEKQKNLFQQQTDGFKRDAEQKLAKMMIDTWSVRQSTDGALVDANGLADAEINKVVAKAKTGIGVV